MLKTGERKCKSPPRRSSTSLTPFSITDILHGRSSRSEDHESHHQEWELEATSRGHHLGKQRSDRITDTLQGSEDHGSQQDWDHLETTFRGHQLREPQPSRITDILQGRCPRRELLEVTSPGGHHREQLQRQREDLDVQALDMSRKSVEGQLQGRPKSPQSLCRV